MRIGRDQLLVTLILSHEMYPGWCSRIKSPLWLRLSMANGFACTAVQHLCAGLSFPESIGSRVGGVCEDMPDGVVDRHLPNHLRFAGIPRQCRETDSLLPEPQ